MKKLILFCSLMVFSIGSYAQIDEKPSDPEADSNASALYSYLRDNVWGKKVLSGCQAEWNYNINEAEKIQKVTGKYPAVNVFDFQHFDQSWINYRTSTALNWHNNGGIVGFMWHIHMPTNCFAEFQADWDSFYSGGDKPCYISPSKATTEGTLDNRLFVKKLKGVADLLLYYQKQGIPILFRPLHEASGKWFWWGAEDAKAYKALYVYMHDFFTSAGIHNLLWMWTSQLDDDDWYPGDEYVDIIARDGYPNGNTTHISMADDFKKLRKAHPNKMLALAECNSVPSWENMQNDGALWLFVAPWCGGGTFGEGNDNDFWTQFLSEDGILSRDEISIGE